MTKNFSQEIDILEKICFDINYDEIDGKKIHNLLVDTIVNAFTSLGYIHVLKKYVKFEKINPKTYEFQGKMIDGRMDLLLYKNKKNIVVEVDRGSVLKLKYISKLISSKSELKIGVLYPKRKGIVNDKEIIERITKIKSSKNLTTQILIINVKDRKSYYVWNKQFSIIVKSRLISYTLVCGYRLNNSTLQVENLSKNEGCNISRFNVWIGPNG